MPNWITVTGDFKPLKDLSLNSDFLLVLKTPDGYVLSSEKRSRVRYQSKEGLIEHHGNAYSPMGAVAWSDPEHLAFELNEGLPK